MTNINTYMPVEVISGKGCVKTFDRYNSLGERCAVITGKNMYKKCSVIDDLKEALTKNGVSYVLICEAENNPTPQNVFTMAKKAVEIGTNIAVIGTVASTLKPSCALIEKTAAQMGKEVNVKPCLLDV